ncbi:MAG TPA: hypothetical protein VMS22_25730 [Candidatus Eisenbacteria bacterium]|nr:hypothetical protein [Candidatus Eisenbacteria bacterium]
MTETRASWRADVGLVVVSAAVLTLEVLQTKLFGFSLDPLSIYVAVAMCMLGLSAAATLLAILPPLPPERASRLAALGSAGGAVAIVVAHVLFAAWSPAVRTGGIGVAVVLAAMVLPYFGFGLTTTLLLVGGGERIGRTYALNLAGSGLGCLLVFPFLDAFGAERSLALVGIMGVATGALLAPARPAGVRAAVGVAALALVATFAGAPRLFAFQPDPTGQVAVIMSRIAKLDAQHGAGTAEATPVFSRWDRTGRIDVYRLTSSRPELQGRIGGPVETLFFAQDASAGSILLGVGGDLSRAREFFDRTVYASGYVTGPRRDVLVIGLGGGPDVLSALYHGASRVVGVEINRTVIDLVRYDLADFVGRPYDRLEVTLQQLDGRTFLRQSPDSFDLIQLSGVDTKSVFFASAGLALNESYLYTRQAMGELLRRLRPDGVLALNRFKTDVQRLTSVAVAGLRDLGVEAPERHVIVVGQGLWRTVLVKRSPFTPAEVALVGEWVKQNPTAPPIVVPAYDWIGVSFQYPLEIVYSPPPAAVAVGPFFEALAGGTLDAFIAAQMFDFSPPDDDRPFFFFPVRPKDMLRSGAPGLDEVTRLARWLTIVSIAVIVVPLVLWRRRGLRAPRAGRTLAYFACLGVGFMFVEIGLIHRFVLLLGHQTYAINVVLFGLLLGAGLGSLSAARLVRGERGRLRVALAALIAGVVVVALGLGVAFDWVATFGFGSRLALALVLLVALGFLLGIPFPTGLAALAADSQELVAWAIGINGFASVVGGTLAVPTAMIGGFRSLALLAAALYVIAALAAPLRADE